MLGDGRTVDVAQLVERAAVRVAQVRPTSFSATAQLAFVWQWPRSTIERRENSASCGSRVRAPLAAR